MSIAERLRRETETETESIYLDCFFTVESDFINPLRINRDGEKYIRTISDFYSAPMGYKRIH